MTIAKKHNAVPNSNPFTSNRRVSCKIDHYPWNSAQIVGDARDHGLRFMSASDVLFRSDGYRDVRHQGRAAEIPISVQARVSMNNDPISRAAFR